MSCMCMHVCGCSCNVGLACLASCDLDSLLSLLLFYTWGVSIWTQFIFEFCTANQFFFFHVWVLVITIINITRSLKMSCIVLNCLVQRASSGAGIRVVQNKSRNKSLYGLNSVALVYSAHMMHVKVSMLVQATTQSFKDVTYKTYFIQEGWLFSDKQK